MIKLNGIKQPVQPSDAAYLIIKAANVQTGMCALLLKKTVLVEEKK